MSIRDYLVRNIPVIRKPETAVLVDHLVVGIFIVN